jgi:hypothetical protein
MSTTPDHNFGAAKEAELTPLIRERICKTLEPTTDRYALFDFECKTSKTLVELKSRKTTAHQYPTTIVGLNKIVEAKAKHAKGWRVVFVISFSDSVRTIEYPFKFTVANITRNDRGGKSKQHACIKVSDMKVLTGDVRSGDDISQEEDLRLLYDFVDLAI